MSAEITPNARKFLEATPLKALLGIPDEALDAVMAVAYQLYQAGRYPEVEVMCRGLSAADHTYWWSYSLHAATLRRQGKLIDALAELEKGLVYEPQNQKLLAMRAEILEVIARESAPAATAPAPATDAAPAVTESAPATDASPAVVA